MLFCNLSILFHKFSGGLILSSTTLTCIKDSGPNLLSTAQSTFIFDYKRNFENRDLLQFPFCKVFAILTPYDNYSF